MLSSRVAATTLLMSAIASLACITLSVSSLDMGAAEDPNAWKMLPWYPPHYTAAMLSAPETIDIDGVLNDTAWNVVNWHYPGFVDITKHTDVSANAVPELLQVKTKLRWDADYLYIAAELNEPYINGTLTGSGTTEYYMEFEMAVLNTTYDIKWGKPDCTPIGESKVVVDTGYSGNWSMASSKVPRNQSVTRGARGTTAADHAGDTGMITATSWDPLTVNKYSSYNSDGDLNKWTIEVRFPIHSKDGDRDNGGRLSPVHTGGQACQLAKSSWPSLLGCYWEWVSGVVGTAVPGVGYMHRPATWPILEFTPPPPKLPGGSSSSGSAPIAPEPCRNIEYPGRHVALS
eukprot:gene14735-3233_t